MSTGCSVSLMSCRRVCACPLQRPRACDSAPGSQPEPRGQPAAEQQPGGERVLAVAHGHAARSSSGPAAGAASRTPPPRARATASSAATRGRRRRCRRTGRPRASARPRRRARPGSRSARSGRAGAARRSPRGCPCGDHTIVARSVTTSGSTIVSSFGRWRSPIEQLHALAPDRDRARLRARPRCRSARVAASRRRPGSTATSDQPRRVEAPDALEPVLDLAAELLVDDHDHVHHARRHVRALLLVALGEHVAAAPPRSAPGVVSSSRQTSSMATALASGAGRSARRRRSGPPEPDA